MQLDATRNSTITKLSFVLSFVRMYMFWYLHLNYQLLIDILEPRQQAMKPMTFHRRKKLLVMYPPIFRSNIFHSCSCVTQSHYKLQQCKALFFRYLCSLSNMKTFVFIFHELTMFTYMLHARWIYKHARSGQILMNRYN